MVITSTTSPGDNFPPLTLIPHSPSYFFEVGISNYQFIFRHFRCFLLHRDILDIQSRGHLRHDGAV